MWATPVWTLRFSFFFAPFLTPILFRLLLLGSDRLALTPFAGSGIGPGSLSSHRKSSSMPQAPVTPDVHQPLDVHGDLSAKVAFDPEVPFDDLPEPDDLLLPKILDPGIRVDLRHLEDPIRGGPSDPENIREADLDSFFSGQIHTGYPSHVSSVSMKTPSPISSMPKRCSGPHPCLCLCRGFSQMTRTTPFRLMILHFAQIPLTEERTFIKRPHLPLNR